MEGGEARIEVLQANPLEDPLAFLVAEHARQRALLGHLERLARHSAGRAHAPIARALAAWLACELPLHLADETCSVFPRLGGEASGLLAELTTQRDALEALRPALRADLARIATGRHAAADFAARAADFAARYRRILATEEARLLPLAQRSLTPAACAAIAREMSGRRA